MATIGNLIHSDMTNPTERYDTRRGMSESSIYPAFNVLARLNASPGPECVETRLRRKDMPLADPRGEDSLLAIGAVEPDAVVLAPMQN